MVIDEEGIIERLDYPLTPPFSTKVSIKRLFDRIKKMFFHISIQKNKHTVLPQLVRMHTIKLMSFSGFVLTERAYYPRGRTIQLFTS